MVSGVRPMRVRSAVDSWLTVAVVATIAVLIASVVFLPGAAGPLGLAVTAVIGGFLLWLYFGTYYELRDEHLYCRSGPFVERIPYDRIKSLRLCRNLYSSMALSLDRIEIRQHGRGFVTGTTMISPVDRERFLEQLQARCRNTVA